MRLLSFEGGRASLIEVTLAGESPAVDRDIVDLDFPRDSTVVAVLRNDRVIVPRGDTRLQAGDEVLVLVTADSIDEVRRDPHRRLSRVGAPVRRRGQPMRRCSRPPR